MIFFDWNLLPRIQEKRKAEKQKAEMHLDRCRTYHGNQFDLLCSSHLPLHCPAVNESYFVFSFIYFWNQNNYPPNARRNLLAIFRIKKSIIVAAIWTKKSTVLCCAAQPQQIYSHLTTGRYRLLIDLSKKQIKMSIFYVDLSVFNDAIIYLNCLAFRMDGLCLCALFHFVVLFFDQDGGRVWAAGGAYFHCVRLYEYILFIYIYQYKRAIRYISDLWDFFTKTLLSGCFLIR